MLPLCYMIIVYGSVMCDCIVKHIDACACTSTNIPNYAIVKHLEPFVIMMILWILVGAETSCVSFFLNMSHFGTLPGTHGLCQEPTMVLPSELDFVVQSV